MCYAAHAGVPVSTRDGRTRDLPDLQGQYIAFPRLGGQRYQYSPLPGEAGAAFCAEISRGKINDAGSPGWGMPGSTAVQKRMPEAQKQTGCPLTWGHPVMNSFRCVVTCC